MNILDTRTIMICYLIANALSAMVLTSLWRQNRRLPGLNFWLADFTMQFAGIALIILRGNVPNFFSMVVSNTLIIGGTLLLFIGLEKYTDRLSTQWHNYFSLAVFFTIQTYFTLVKESLQYRNVNISFFMMLFSLQAAWLLLRRADGRMCKGALSTGLILSGLGVLSLIRIFIDLSIHPGNDFFKSGFYDSIILLIYQMLNLSLTFALFLMVNRRLLTTLENDITERTLADEALRENESLLRTIAENYPNSFISIIEKDLTVGYTAGREFKKLNLDPNQFVGLTLEQIFGEHTPFVTEKYLKTFDGAETQFELFINDQHQYYRTVPLMDRNDRITRILSVVENITERKQAEEALRASEESYRFLANNVPDIIYSLDGEGNIVTVNSSAFERYGYTEQDSMGKPFLNFIHPEDREIVIGSFLKALEEQRIFTQGLQFRIVAGSGDSYWFELNSHARFDSQGGYAGEEGVLRDITARKHVEDALRESEDKLKTIIETSPDGIGISTLDGTVQFVTAKLVSALGYASTAEMIGRNTMDFVHSSYQEKMRYLVTELLNDHLTGPAECLMVRKDGGHFYCEANANILRDVEKNPIGILIVERDITARKQAEDALRESEEKFRSLLDSQESNILMLDFDGVHHYVNQVSVASMIGSGTAQDIIGKSLHDLYPAQIADWQLEQIRRVITTGQGMSGDFQNVMNGGSSWWHLNLQPIRNASGQVEQVMVNSRDITERKQAEEALQKSAQLLEKTLSSLLDAVFIIDADTVQIVDCNPAASAIFGYSRQEMLGQTTAFLHVNQAALEEFRQHLNSDMEAAKDFMFLPEYKMKRKDGTVFFSEHSVVPLKDKQGQRIGWVSVVRDISERKQAEENLRKSEAKYRILTENMKDVVWTMDAETMRFLYISPSVQKLRGYTAEEIIAEPITAALMPDAANAVLEIIRKRVTDLRSGLIPSDNYFTTYLEQPCKDGSTVWAEQISNYYLNEESGHVEARVVTRDITERKQAENKIHQLNQMGRSISASLNLKQVIAVGMEGMLNAVNPDMSFLFLREDQKLILQEFLPQNAAIKLGQIPEHRVGECMCGMAVQLNKPLYSVDVFSDQRCTWTECKRAGLTSFAALPLRSGDEVIGVIGLASNTRRNFEDQAEFLETLASQISVAVINAQLFENVQSHANILEQRVEERTRELRDAQEQLVRHEKLAVLGQMASSVGHELRNPLAVITSALYYLKLVQPDADEKIKQYLDMIQQEVHTSEKIITDLLDFARIKSVDREAVSVSELIRQTLERFPAPASVNVTIDIPTDLPKVFVDLRQMTQVLGNLTVNACQAMKDGGKLTVISRQSSVKAGSLITDNWILITVKDTGVGISAENMKKLFEPLFTTKAKGIGLGLVVSQKLVEANGGRIEVSSEAGVGSTFTVWLPVK